MVNFLLSWLWVVPDKNVPLAEKFVVCCYLFINSPVRQALPVPQNYNSHRWYSLCKWRASINHKLNTSSLELKIWTNSPIFQCWTWWTLCLWLDTEHSCLATWLLPPSPSRSTSCSGTEGPRANPSTGNHREGRPAVEWDTVLVTMLDVVPGTWEPGGVTRTSSGTGLTSSSAPTPPNWGWRTSRRMRRTSTDVVWTSSLPQHGILSSIWRSSVRFLDTFSHLVP